MVISDAFLQEIKFRCDIESVVSKYVNLKKSGRDLVGLCPFHNEKTPSFHVSTEQQYFHCFGCGAGGDVITFVMKIENLDYIDALRFLAAQAGLDFPEEGENNGAAELKKKILEINREAARFFYKCLMSPEGKKGLDYFRRRKLSDSTIRSFGLGFAPDSWNSLYRHLKKSGYQESEMKNAALIRSSQKKDGELFYDQFRNRVMFPIIDVRGNVIAFGGRVLDDSKPKYLNSPDTPVFKKSRCLYALNRAKNGNGESLILCEGYMDVIAMHQAGFGNTVATLGTALTPEQSKLMSRYAKEVVISYDSDEAGQKAAQRAIRLLSEAGLRVKVLRIEGGKDPDEFIKSYGADKFRLMLNKSSGQLEYRLAAAKAKYDTAEPEGKVSYMKEAAEILSTVESPIEREVYASRLQQELEVSKDAILMEAESRRKKKKKAVERASYEKEISASAGLRDRVNPEKAKYLRAAKAEESLLVLLFHNPDYLRQLEPVVGADDFVTAFNKRVYETLRMQIMNYGEADLSRFSMSFTPDEMGEITACLSKQAVSNTINEAFDCVRVIKREKELKIQSQNREIDILEDLREKTMQDKKKAGGSI